jgi:hypothetical protein
VATLAGVPTYSIRKFGYLMERLEEIPAEKVCAGRAAHRGTAAGFELIHLAEGAVEGAQSRVSWLFHTAFLSVLLLMESMKAAEGQHICQVAIFLYARWHIFLRFRRVDFAKHPFQAA